MIVCGQLLIHFTNYHSRGKIAIFVRCHLIVLRRSYLATINAQVSTVNSHTIRSKFFFFQAASVKLTYSCQGIEPFAQHHSAVLVVPSVRPLKYPCCNRASALHILFRVCTAFDEVLNS